MTNQHALSFARSPAVILFETENDNMWSDWEDYIVATRTKKGVFSVLARKLSDQYLDGKTKRKWFLIHSVTQITEPAHFIKAVKECEQELNVDVYWDDVTNALEKLDQNFSVTVKNLIDEM
jgi:hypothetical protein